MSTVLILPYKRPHWSVRSQGHALFHASLLETSQVDRGNWGGCPDILPTPAGCAPSRVFKVKGNWTPASSSSGSAFGACSSGRAQARTAAAHRIPTAPAAPGSTGRPEAVRAGARRGRFTRSPGRSAGRAEALAAPLLHECAPGSNRAGSSRGHNTPDRGAVTSTPGPLLPPSIPPRGLAHPGLQAPPRPFRWRRRGESGPGGAHGRGCGNAATPAGDRASEDCAEARPGPSGARKPVPRVSTWLKRICLHAVSLDFLGSRTLLNSFESYNVSPEKCTYPPELTNKISEGKPGTTRTPRTHYLHHARDLRQTWLPWSSAML
ncbi:uncharacterized protein LOC125101669 [Lutra lutra]|uniref:uncharacterized protein LOC125101669 n=1 Tax=Lutra lutra TaxID=9657 RepID=UPI001FD4BA0A|nr:uncharacterized protein LOC125101669 [Lutra lutra]